MTQPTVRDIATANPAAVRVFEKYGIDYCCGGGRPLEEACREKGISAEAVLAEVRAGGSGETGGQDWTKARLGDLIAYIVRKHHAYLHAELPVLETRMLKVLEKHGPNHAGVLPRLGSMFADLKSEMEMHLRKEEMILFPAIEEMESAQINGVTPQASPFGTVRNPIRMMEHEHDSAGAVLRSMREVTENYTPPADACPTFIALYNGLDALEKDLHAHIHLENNILFPRAAALENSLVCSR
jgi:regulator of cell morphogenesis and NO signaling